MKRKRERKRKKDKCSSSNTPIHSNNKSMVLIRGRSGTGKSTLVHQFHQQLIHQGSNKSGLKTPTQSSWFPCGSTCGCYNPYILIGKFVEQQHDDQRNDDAMCAFVDAFQGLLQQILHAQTPQEERQRIRNSILTHVIMDHNHPDDKGNDHSQGGGPISFIGLSSPSSLAV